MRPIFLITIIVTLLGSLSGCTNFINRFNKSNEEKEHIIVVLPRTPAPVAAPAQAQVQAPIPVQPQVIQQTNPQYQPSYRLTSLPPTAVVSGILTNNHSTESGVRVIGRPITVDTPYRAKEIAVASDVQPPAPPATPKPSETQTPKTNSPEPTPVVEMKPVAPTPPPAPLVNPVPVPIEAAPPVPKATAESKPVVKNQSPSPDSLGGLLARRAVYYDFDAAQLSDEYKAVVIAHAKYLAQNPKEKVKLRGNCDERGSREYNISLGSNRAESVKQLMIANGAAAKQIETESFGKEKPMALGHDEQSWAKNRRVDILYSDDE